MRPLQNTTVLFKHTVSLYCLAFSQGVLTYDWKRLNGKNISSNSRKLYAHKMYSDANQETITYQLVIPKVKLSDEGWYCCIATNDAGSRGKCVWLEVDSKLKFLTWLINKL